MDKVKLTVTMRLWSYESSPRLVFCGSPAVHHPRHIVLAYKLSLLACLCAHLCSSLRVVTCSQAAAPSTGGARVNPISSSATLLAGTADAIGATNNVATRVLAAKPQAAAKRESGTLPCQHAESPEEVPEMLDSLQDARGSCSASLDACSWCDPVNALFRCSHFRTGHVTTCQGCLLRS